MPILQFNKKNDETMVYSFVETLLSRTNSEHPAFVNIVVYKIPEEEKLALVNGIRTLFSGNDKYGVITVPREWGRNRDLLEFDCPAPQGVIFIDGIASADRHSFEAFRHFLKEPERAGIPGGWVMVSFWEDKALDLFDEGIASAVSTFKYQDIVEDGETIAEFFAKVESGEKK